MTHPHDIDHYQLPKLQNLEMPDRFDKLDAILDKAHTEGLVAPLPGSKQEVRPIELNESRICTIRTRLYLLGYLKRDNSSPEIDTKLENAIHRFQTDAGLEPDSWVGRETWTALQELVSFENPSNLSDWFKEGPIKPALLRAIKLRLFALGFLPSKQARDSDKLQTALDKFVLVAGILRLHEKQLSAAVVLETINILFDQDHIAARMGQAGNDFMKYLPPEIPEKQARRSIHKFSVCCAKVELWLLGYDVPLDGSAKFDTPGQTEIFSYLPIRYPVYHALYGFWRENGKRQKKARERARRITGRFFAKLLQLQQEGALIADTDQSAQLYEMLVIEKEDVLNEIWKHIKSIGSRIWDGIKRVWRWLKSLFKTVAKKMRAWAKNIARLAYRFALNGFSLVNRLVKITKETASFLVHKTLTDSDVGNIVIKRDRDYDYRIYVNPERSHEKVKGILMLFYEKAHLFSMGMRIIGLTVGALIAVITKVPLAGGWFGLVLAMLKIYSSLKEITDVLTEEQAFMKVV